MKTSLKMNNKGFTLIELMIVAAIIGITMAMFAPLYYQSLKASESQVSLQVAHRALRNEVEILRSLPGDELSPGQTLPFDRRVEELEALTAGRGVVKMESSPDTPGLVEIRVEVHWRDPVIGMRSIHTILYRHVSGGVHNGN